MPFNVKPHPHANRIISPPNTAKVKDNSPSVRTIEPMRWGLIPAWSKDMKGGFITFNARANGIDIKPTFKGAWKAGRRAVWFLPAASLNGAKPA